MATTLAELDLLAPFEIWEVRLDNGAYIKFHQPLVFQPEWLPDDPNEPGDKKYLLIEYDDLGISAFGCNRRELRDCLLGDIRSAWTEYVCEDDNKLSPGAKSIKSTYLEIAEVLDA